VSKLNDPFDPYFFLELAFDGKYATIIESAKKNKTKRVEDFMRIVNPDEWLIILDNMRSFIDKTKSSTFMLSLIECGGNSHSKDNILMWSHYGHGHRGVLLQFDPKLLYQSVISTNEIAEKKSDHIEYAIMQVRYTKKIKPISVDDILDFYQHADPVSEEKTKLIQYMRNSLSTKSTDWRYEREWRMLWQNDETENKIINTPILPGTVKVVYIGIESSDEIQCEILELARRSDFHFSVCKAKKRVGEFGLNFTQIA
jgi:hypothetical protein